MEENNRQEETYKDIRIIYHVKENGIAVYVYRKNARRPSVSFFKTGDVESAARKYIDYVKGQADARHQRKADRIERNRKAREQFVNPYTMDQIVYDSWGYDQTNIDWYQIVKIGPRSVTLRPIAGQIVEATGSMSGQTIPAPGHFTGDPITKTIQVYMGSDDNIHHYIPSKHGSIGVWKEGEKLYCSWYA
jgi:hypothetical protein